MARIRTIKPEFWKHEDLSAMPEATHMLAAALLNYADDDGYFNANPLLIKAECCPLREPSVSLQDSLRTLASSGYLALGRGTDGKAYGRIVAFRDHQVISRPTPSKISNIDIIWEDSRTTHGVLNEASVPEGKGKEGKGKEGKGERASAPRPRGKQFLPSDYSLTETLLVKAKAALRLAGKQDVNYQAEFVRFCEHFWSPDSRNRAKSDWDRAFVNWCLSEYSKPSAEQGVLGPQGDPQDVQWRSRLRNYKSGGYWPDVWGSRPGEPGCVAPRHLLQELGINAEPHP